MSLRQSRNAILALAMTIAPFTTALAADLPNRETPIPETTNGVPHVQIGVQAVPELSKELLRRVSELPGVTLGPTRVSLPGAVGFQLNDDHETARPDVIVGGREFAHLHPDGSLHASLSPELAQEAIQKGWAVAHPWSDQRDGWEGFVMIYSPATQDELNVVIQLVEQSYRFVTSGMVEE